MSHDEMIAVIAAHKEGKVIQFRCVDQQQKPWEDYGADGGPSWNFYHFDFRIKPEPRKPRSVYIEQFGNGELNHSQAYCPAYVNQWDKHDGKKLIKFIEVIEDEP